MAERMNTTVFYVRDSGKGFKYGLSLSDQRGKAMVPDLVAVSLPQACMCKTVLFSLKTKFIKKYFVL